MRTFTPVFLFVALVASAASIITSCTIRPGDATDPPKESTGERADDLKVPPGFNINNPDALWALCGLTKPPNTTLKFGPIASACNPGTTATDDDGKTTITIDPRNFNDTNICSVLQHEAVHAVQQAGIHADCKAKWPNANQVTDYRVCRNCVTALFSHWRELEANCQGIDWDKNHPMDRDAAAAWGPDAGWLDASGPWIQYEGGVPDGSAGARNCASWEDSTPAALCDRHCQQAESWFDPRARADYKEMCPRFMPEKWLPKDAADKERSHDRSTHCGCSRLKPAPGVNCGGGICAKGFCGAEGAFPNTVCKCAGGCSPPDEEEHDEATVMTDGVHARSAMAMAIVGPDAEPPASEDAGVCADVCGDGFCSGSETCETCAGDCACSQPMPEFPESDVLVDFEIPDGGPTSETHTAE